jgi:hypothetical protein
MPIKRKIANNILKMEEIKSISNSDKSYSSEAEVLLIIFQLSIHFFYPVLTRRKKKEGSYQSYSHSRHERRDELNREGRIESN